MTSVSEWRTFFISAGLPQSVASAYAETFYTHRIQMNMLKDLNKDILLDMNIKAMGDVIAILRHANHVQLGPSINSKATPSVTASSISSPQNYHQRPPSSDSRTNKFSLHPNSNSTSNQSLNHHGGVKRLASEVGNYVGGNHNFSPQAKRPVKPSANSSTVSSNRGYHPVGRSEQERTLTVRMPEGTTERTKKFLSQVAEKSNNKTLRSTVGSVSTATTYTSTSRIIPSVMSRLSTTKTSHISKDSSSSHSSTINKSNFSVQDTHERNSHVLPMQARLGDQRQHSHAPIRSRTSVNPNVFSRLG